MEKNLIFCGPPGTGKTYRAKEKAIQAVWNYCRGEGFQNVAEEKYYRPGNFCERTYDYVTGHYLAKGGRPLIRLVALHDGMAPSDLLRGISFQGRDGRPTFQEVDRVVLELISDIEESGKLGVLILDDIQRVSLTGVIGELFYGFAHRGERVTLSTGGSITVPENLYVFLTLNPLLPQYPLDTSILSGFSMVHMQNGADVLRQALESWWLKSFYFTEASEEVDSILAWKELLSSWEMRLSKCTDNAIIADSQGMGNDGMAVNSPQSIGDGTGNPKNPGRSAWTGQFQAVLDEDYAAIYGGERIKKLIQKLIPFSNPPAGASIDTVIWGKELPRRARSTKGRGDAAWEEQNQIYEAARKLIYAAAIICRKYEKCVESLENLLRLSMGQWQRYHDYVNANLSLEYEADRELFEIGYAYFLPPDVAFLQNASELLRYKVRGQILPLMKQYLSEGILRASEVPGYETTATRYSFTDNGDPIVYEEETALTNTFQANKGMWTTNRVKNPLNLSQPFNTDYCFVCDIVKDLIEAHLISSWQMMDILCQDYDILNRMSNDAAGHAFRGGLLAQEEVASTILSGDTSKRKSGDGGYLVRDDGQMITSGNSTLPSYAIDLLGRKRGKKGKELSDWHKVQYRRRTYFFFKKFDRAKEETTSTAMQCREKKLFEKSDKPRRVMYQAVKVLIYDFIRQYRENLEKCLKEPWLSAMQRQRVNDSIIMADAALQTVDQMRWHGNGATGLNCEDERRLNFYTEIKQMPFWQEMGKDEAVRRLQGVYMTLDDRYQAVMDATGIHQMILQGPPGTSKTYGAKEFLAKEMGLAGDGRFDNEELEKRMLRSGVDANGNDVYLLPDVDSEIYWDIIQFHPSYTYEDFVRGITVHTTHGGKAVLHGSMLEGGEKKYDLELEQASSLTYRTVNKALGKMARLAKEQENRGRKFYLVIDEINRANLATVFGELIYALEYRGGKGVTTPYAIDGDANVTIPDNLYIIGTMNTADKSIASIDYAIRRRFLFFPVLPDIKVVYKNVGGDLQAVELRLFYLISKYFEKYYNDEDYEITDIQVGHTFFLRKGGTDASGGGTSFEDQMKYRFLYQVIPVLREYLNDGILRRDPNSGTADFSNLAGSFQILRDLLQQRGPAKTMAECDRLFADVMAWNADILNGILSEVQ